MECVARGNRSAGTALVALKNPRSDSGARVPCVLCLSGPGCACAVAARVTGASIQKNASSSPRGSFLAGANASPLPLSLLLFVLPGGGEVVERGCRSATIAEVTALVWASSSSRSLSRSVGSAASVSSPGGGAEVLRGAAASCSRNRVRRACDAERTNAHRPART